MRWQMTADEVQQVVDKLIDERFVDNARYADAFVRDKLRFSGWGRRRIVNALRAKQISLEVISSLEHYFVDEEDSERLTEMLEKKARQVKARNAYDLRDKLVRFGLYRGFELEKLLPIAIRISTEKFSCDE